MAHTFTLPDLGEGLTEGEIARWLVSEGEAVAENEPIVEIQTDKATVEVGSPVDGVVLRIVVQEGQVAPVGATLAVIGAAGEHLLRPVATAARAATGAGRARSSPSSAPSRSRRCDCTASRASSRSTSPRFRAPAPAASVTEADVRAAAAPPEGRRVPVRGIRRAIVEQVERTHREIPAVTFVEECDFTGVDLDRLVAPSLKAAAASLGAFPELNARIEGDEIVLLDRYDLGVAVDTDAGLVVPVVRGCDRPLGRGDRRRDPPARRGRPRRHAAAGRAARLDLHRHERRQARRPLRDAR